MVATITNQSWPIMVFYYMVTMGFILPLVEHTWLPSTYTLGSTINLKWYRLQATGYGVAKASKKADLLIEVA